jgi:hypothetical protein
MPRLPRRAAETRRFGWRDGQERPRPRAAGTLNPHDAADGVPAVEDDAVVVRERGAGRDLGAAQTQVHPGWRPTLGPLPRVCGTAEIRRAFAREGAIRKGGSTELFAVLICTDRNVVRPPIVDSGDRRKLSIPGSYVRVV